MRLLQHCGVVKVIRVAFSGVLGRAQKQSSQGYRTPVLQGFKIGQPQLKASFVVGVTVKNVDAPNLRALLEVGTTKTFVNNASRGVSASLATEDLDGRALAPQIKDHWLMIPIDGAYVLLAVRYSSTCP